MKALRFLFDLVCPFIKAGQQLPYGFSRGNLERGGPDTERVRLLLPIGVWFGRRYQPHLDCDRRGWWLVSFLLGVTNVPGGFDVNLRVGFWPRGNGALKSLRGHDDRWYDEQAFEHGRFVEKGHT